MTSNFTKNYDLAKWVNMMKLGYSLPDKTTLTNNHLVKLYYKATLEWDKRLKDTDVVTMTLMDTDRSEIIDIINLSKE